MSIYFQASVSAIKKKSHWQLYDYDNGIKHWCPSKEQCKIFKGLTLMGPCIANIFAEYNQQAATFHNLFISKMLYVFQTVFLSIIRSSKLHIQHQVLVRPLYEQFWAPDDGRKNRLKHAEHPEINKLWNITTCWLYSANIFKGVHFMLQVNLNLQELKNINN